MIGIRYLYPMALLSLLSTAMDAGALEPYYHEQGLLRGSMVNDEPVPIYSPDRMDSWNRLFNLLHAKTVEVKVSSYFRADAPRSIPQARIDQDWRWGRERLIDLHYQRVFGSRFAAVQRLVGGDLPDFYFRDGRDTDFLLADTRFSKLRATLLEVADDGDVANRTVEARVLFQQDLWSRFDLLHRSAAEVTDKEKRERLDELLRLVGGAIASLAPDRAALAGIEDNWPDIVSAHADYDVNFLADHTLWRELIVDADELFATDHASAAGYRRVFRVFVKAPAQATDPQCLEKELTNQNWLDTELPECALWGRVLAYGSRAVLVESLLALTDDGSIVPVPLITSVQMRDVRAVEPGPDRQYGLDDLAFHVLHGQRRTLLTTPRVAGGLTPLASDEPVPHLFAAFTRSRTEELVPLRWACTQCHLLDGSALMIGNRHGVKRLRVLPPGSSVMGERVMELKRQSEDYEVLKGFFAR